MKDLTLQFQEQQICYVCNFMFDDLQQYYATFRDVNNTIKLNDYPPTGIVAASISPDNLLAISAKLGTQQEVLTSGFHETLNTSLLQQLMTIAQGEDADAAASANYVLQELQARAASSQAWVNAQIEAGREKLKV